MKDGLQRKKKHAHIQHKISTWSNYMYFTGFGCLVLSKPTYYKYSLYESTCIQVLFTYPIEPRKKYVPFTHMFLFERNKYSKCTGLQVYLEKFWIRAASVFTQFCIVCHISLLGVIQINGEYEKSKCVFKVVEIYQSDIILMTLTNDLYSVHTLYT